MAPVETVIVHVQLKKKCIRKNNKRDSPSFFGIIIKIEIRKNKDDTNNRW